MLCSNSNSDGHLSSCLINQVGSSLSENKGHGSLVKPGAKLAAKHFGSFSSKTMSDQSSKGQEIKFNSLRNSHHNSSDISIENGGRGNQKWENNRIMQENLGLAFVFRDQNYWQIPSQFNEGVVRLRTQATEGIFRVEIILQNVFQIFSDIREHACHACLPKFQTTWHGDQTLTVRGLLSCNITGPREFYMSFHPFAW